ncbi:MAG: hypothetical protein HeimC3_00720 [Candidatus Heimdallarchaeota archaeon LC_3]|nr:MAG: hypothetical protein HeimC3_00720 [Candidatus Heimdallarchaeota archaeon LC_3]
MLNISLNRLIYIYLWRFVVIPNSKPEKVSKIIKSWINNNPEALLCQRFLDDKISFSPIWMKKLEINFLYFLTINNKNTLKSLEKSKIVYKTISITTHRSSKSDPTENKGILFIGNIVNWNDSKTEFNTSFSNSSVWKQNSKLLLVKIEIFKVNYWSGINFGSHSFKRIPKNLFKGFRRKSFLPHWKNGKKVSLEEWKIINSSQYLIVATITEMGAIHATPVDFTVIKNRVVFATSFFSAKFRGFKKSNILSGYTYKTTEGFNDYSRSLTFHGSPFAYGWNFLTSIVYGFLFAPYLGFAGLWMFRKYPQTMRKFPFKQTNIRWQFIPFVARTFIEIFWQDN